MCSRINNNASFSALNHDSFFCVGISSDIELQHSSIRILDIGHDGVIDSILFNSHTLNTFSLFTWISNLAHLSQVHSDIKNHATRLWIPNSIFRFTVGGTPTKICLNRHNLSNLSCTNKLLNLARGRETPRPHALHKKHIFLSRQLYKRLCILVRQRQWFFHHGRLFGQNTLSSKWKVTVSNASYIDDIDVLVGKQLLVASIRLLDIVLVGKLLCLCRRSCCNRNCLGALSVSDCLGII
mmetsp:Transcript_10152/g.18450  ORF Transcript_10152/g.18450 Transcript_10152/m.18450 type:complete len:239 (+) Transcript_10152:419-1135(+)